MCGDQLVVNFIRTCLIKSNLIITKNRKVERMNIRKLNYKDAPFMLEWMHDESVVKDLQTNFLSKTIEDCMDFIQSTQTDHQNYHLAVVDDNDTYMGTVSLKNIIEDSAEFAITIRKEAMGKGISRYAMDEMLKIGIEQIGLKTIYWCVSPDNRRAIRFYDKNHYKRFNINISRILNIINNFYTQEQIEHYIWYRKDE